MTPRTQLSVTMDNVPGTLAKMCSALRERQVNIVGLMSIEHEGRSVVRMVVDKVPVAKRALQAIGYQFTEESVLATQMRNHPGALAAVATNLGDANININYLYVGAEPGSSRPLVVFSVSDPARAKELIKP